MSRDKNNIEILFRNTAKFTTGILYKREWSANWKYLKLFIPTVMTILESVYNPSLLNIDKNSNSNL